VAYRTGRHRETDSLQKFGTEATLHGVNLTPGYTGKGDFAAMYFLVMVEPPLFLALNELIVAITIPAHITVNCARAIESLRTILVPNDPDRAKGWAELRRVLHLERSYLEFVIKASAEPRHGDKTYMEQAKGQEILERSWIIMNRFRTRNWDDAVSTPPG
jgi:hypothetical protein